MLPKQKNNLDLLFQFAKRRNRPLLLDGAMGSQLQQRGIQSHPQLWMSAANLSQPNEVIKLHKAYVKAGADIITANTFRTNPISVSKSDVKINSSQFVKKSVKLAQEAIDDKKLILAGSNPPAEDCYRVERRISKKEIEANHTQHIESLMQSGCHLILNETQSHFDEILFVSKFCDRNSIPYMMSLFFTTEMKILSGENLFEVIKLVEDCNPLAIGFNCIMQNTFQKAFHRISKNSSWGFYMNCGGSAINNDNIVCGISPQDYSHEIEKYLPKNPVFIGSCCGSSPNHTKELRKLLDEKNCH